MTPWRLRWSPAAIAALKRMHWLDASAVARAVRVYARTGEGDVYRLPEDGPTTARLRAGSYRVWLIFDRVGHELHAWLIYRA